MWRSKLRPGVVFLISPIFSKNYIQNREISREMRNTSLGPQINKIRRWTNFLFNTSELPIIMWYKIFASYHWLFSMFHLGLLVPEPPRNKNLQNKRSKLILFHRKTLLKIFLTYYKIRVFKFQISNFSIWRKWIFIYLKKNINL